MDNKNVTIEQMLDFANRADQRLDRLELYRQKITALVPISIPTEGWETDETYPEHPNCYDIAIPGLLKTDIVVMESLPQSNNVVRAANFMQTETYAGKVRLRAENVPTEAISAQYRIINTASYGTQKEET